ncbi:MAG TPA: DMT family transporter [Longimicrobiales bacterium]|nr:DMT family transporter [Longimicrobiales bacterium]
MIQKHPPLSPALVLVIAVLAMSWAGPLVKFATAPAVVVSAWRLVFSVAFIALVLAVRRTSLAAFRLQNRQWLLAGAAGVLLAAHFWAWIASLRYTTVASSVVLVSMQPIFVAAMSAALLHERATRKQWLGIVIACTGALAIGVSDAQGQVAPRAALLGDALALAGALFVSGYYVIGRELRQQLDLWVYIAIVYGIAALVLVLVAAFDPRVQLTGYPPRDWWIFAALAAGPMMLGHTGVNYALRYVRAYVANIVIMAEPVGATIIAWTLPALREVPRPGMLVGAVLILGGILLGSTWRKPS